jgi:hypothetical protein
MNPDQIEKLRTTRPFVPFTIHVSDGVSYRVPSSEYLLRTKSGRQGNLSGRNLSEIAGEHCS